MKLLDWITFLFPIITLIVALINYKKHKSKFMFFLCGFLLSAFLVESYGTYHRFFDTGVHTLDAYNIFIFFEFSFILLSYRSLLGSKNFSFVIDILFLLFLIIYLLSFVSKTITPFDLIPLESSVIAIVIVMYLAGLLKSDKIIDYKRHLPFWVSVGFFVFFLPSIPFFLMFKYMAERKMFFIISLLAIMMNLFIIFGLIWSNKEQKY